MLSCEDHRAAHPQLRQLPVASVWRISKYGVNISITALAGRGKFFQDAPRRLFSNTHWSFQMGPRDIIGFIQESEERVNEMYRRLKDDGFAVEPPKRSHAWTFYIAAPGGFTIEVAA
jgi:hypothetical protein